MRLGIRIITTMAVAFLLAPTLLLCADDTVKSAATAKTAATLAPASSPEVMPTHAVPAVPSSGLLVVSNVTLDKRASGETFVDVSTSRTATYRVTSLKNPARLVVDIDSAKNTSHQKSYSADTLVLRDVRLAQYRETDRSVVRVVADLNGDPTFEVHATPEEMRIELRPRGMANSALPAAKTTAPSPATEPSSAVATAPVAPANVTVAEINPPEPPAAVKSGAAKSQGAPSAVVKAKPAAAPQSAPGKAKPPAKSSDLYIPRFDLFWATRISGTWSSGGNRIGWLAGGSTSFAIQRESLSGARWRLWRLSATRFGAERASDWRPCKRLVRGRLHLHVWSAPFLPAREVHSLCPGSVWRRARQRRDAEWLFRDWMHAPPLRELVHHGRRRRTRHHANPPRGIASVPSRIRADRFQGSYLQRGVTQRQNDMRLSAGLVFRFGREHRPPPPPPPPPPQPPVASCSADKGMVYAGSGDVIGVRAQASSPGQQSPDLHMGGNGRRRGGHRSGSPMELLRRGAGNLFGKSARGRRPGRHGRIVRRIFASTRGPFARRR